MGYSVGSGTVWGISASVLLMTVGIPIVLDITYPKVISSKEYTG